MMLEKIYSKWLSIQPLSEADQNKLSMRFTVEYNYNSNHLEGNTLTYDQTAENGGYPPTQNGDIRSLFWLFSLMALQN